MSRVTQLVWAWGWGTGCGAGVGLLAVGAPWQLAAFEFLAMPVAFVLVQLGVLFRRWAMP